MHAGSCPKTDTDVPPARTGAGRNDAAAPLAFEQWRQRFIDFLQEHGEAARAFRNLELHGCDPAFLLEAVYDACGGVDAASKSLERDWRSFRSSANSLSRRLLRIAAEVSALNLRRYGVESLSEWAKRHTDIEELGDMSLGRLVTSLPSWLEIYSSILEDLVDTYDKRYSLRESARTRAIATASIYVLQVTRAPQYSSL